MTPTPPGPRPAASSDARLARMKAIAAALLVAAGALYALALWQAAAHPAWGYVAAFAEAAMVGAIADWFAVVALFRHPLGVPVPHTAIIPGSQARIGDNLAAFIVGNFLATPQVLARLDGFDPAGRLAAWLAEPRHATRLAAQLGAVLGQAATAFDDEALQQRFGAAVAERLGRLDAARLGARLLALATADRRHQDALDLLLRRLAVVLDDEAVRSRLAEVIADEVKYLRVVGLDHLAGRYAAGKLVAGLVRLVGEMADQPDHRLRLDFDTFVAGFLARLETDPELQAQIADWQHALLASPAVAAHLRSAWRDAIEALRRGLAEPDSALRERLAAAIRQVGLGIEGDVEVRVWINKRLRRAAPALIDRYREKIRAYIAARVRNWDTEEMTRELERNIGRDLQFIRINGTLVGGLAGLAIHAATRWWQGS